MRNTVQIDGVTLTREQVTRAMAELDKPEEPKPFRGGDRFRYCGDERIVVDEWTQKILNHDSPNLGDADNVWTINLRTGTPAVASVAFWREHEDKRP